MLKKMLFAAALTGLVAGALVPAQTSPAEAKLSGCFKAAHAKYPTDAKARHDFRKWCKAEWKKYKKAPHAA
jgi:hypothetical protein